MKVNILFQIVVVMSREEEHTDKLVSLSDCVINMEKTPVAHHCNVTLLS